jgi:serine/threonine protein phosphatase PrpC
MNSGWWRVAGRSVRGASHQRRGAPNQDAIIWAPDHGGTVILAVADGHGSRASYRSGTGSALAVQVVSEVLQEIPERRIPNPES